ncbi:hypothetical protein TRVA0_012S02696 [Trichomonascus vanleenenianus]|uniref:uncharacterized protein n=1 Tax=Trichomonascus vanleenenianus TaxID=2268995 RepID=UPI003ECB7FCD
MDRFYATDQQESTTSVESMEDKIEVEDEAPQEGRQAAFNALMTFEKALTANTEQRIKYVKDPLRYLESEYELVSSIRSLADIEEDFYPLFVEADGAANLVGVITDHDNSDVVIEALRVLNEVVDEGEGPSGAGVAAAIVDNGGAAAIERCLYEFGETEVKQEAVQLVLNLSAQFHASRMTERIVEWLVDNVSDGPYKEQSAETLFITMLNSVAARRFMAHEKHIDVLLHTINDNRARPKDPELVEWLSNIYNTAQVLAEDGTTTKATFVACEGVELMRMLAAGKSKYVRHNALRVLASAVNGLDAGEASVRLIECGGLRTLFTLWNRHLDADKVLERDLVRLLAGLLTWLELDSAARIRTVAKLTEKNRLTTLWQRRQTLTARAASGYDVLQQQPAYWSELVHIDTILAWLIVDNAWTNYSAEQLSSIKHTLTTEKESHLDQIAETQGGDPSDEDVAILVAQSRAFIEMADELLRALPAASH